MSFTSIIEQITNDFIDAWNHHDLDKMASFLANNIVVSSPNVLKLFPEKQDEVISGKDEVMNYWKKLNAEYFFSMRLIEFSKSAKTIHVKIEIGGSTKFLFATFVIDEYGKFVTMEITYK